MNDRAPRVRGGRLLVASVFCGACLAGLTVAQVVRTVRFEVQTSIPQDVTDPEDDDVWPPNTFTLADVNGDDLADLVALSRFDAKVFVYLSRGDGGFEEPMEVPVVDADDFELEPTSVAVGDVGSPFASEVDGEPDGLVDIVVGTLDGVVTILVADGEGSFEVREEELFVLAELIDVHVADFDGDGSLDIAALDSFDEAAVMLNQRGAFDPNGDSFETGGEEATAVEITSGDFDGNGNRDLLVLNRDDRTISLLRGRGDGEFEAPVVLSTTADVIEDDQVPSGLAVADLDHDGNEDAAILNFGLFSDLQLLVRYGPDLDRKGSFPAPFEASAISLGDVDGNGFSDALITSAGSGMPAAVLLDDGAGGFAALGSILVPGIPAGAANALGDFGGDELPDFVQLNVAANEFSVAINVSNPPTATATATEPIPTATPTVIPTPTSTETAGPTVTETATAIPSATTTATTAPSPSRSPSPSATATGTRTSPASPSPATPGIEEDDSCMLVPPGEGSGNGGLAIVLVGLALASMRRRVRNGSWGSRGGRRCH